MIEIGTNLKEVLLAIVAVLASSAVAYSGYKLASSLKNRRNNNLEDNRK